MKFGIAWHENTYINWSKSIEKEQARLKEAQIRLEHELEELAFYRSQIAAAKTQKKDGFDKYKFLIKKNT